MDSESSMALDQLSRWLSHAVGLKLVSIAGDLLLKDELLFFDANKPLSSVVDYLLHVLHGDQIYDLISAEGRLLDLNEMISNGLQDGDVVTVVVRQDLKLRIIDGDELNDMRLSMLTGSDEGSIQVEVYGMDDGIALLNAVKPGVHLEVITEATGEFGISIALMTPSDFQTLKKRYTASATIIDFELDFSYHEKAITFAEQRTFPSFAEYIPPSSLPRVQLRIVERHDGQMELYKDNALFTTVCSGCHWCVIGHGHDGDFGVPEIKIRLFQD